ncbi:MAG TPA: hypothetical protein VGZ32_17290 [Actinocrinis sp.]|nr:hypothetical protein [Actinocrinis sp.]HEV3172109.1 hypothetical protein [Actinocrinis sp.]
MIKPYFGAASANPSSCSVSAGTLAMALTYGVGLLLRASGA